MTEYEELLEKTFKKPKTFVGALKHNPREAARYFALNAIHNLTQIPQKLLITRDQGRPSSNSALLYEAFLGVLICGAVPGIARLRRSYIESQSGDRAKGHVARLGSFWRTHKLLFRKALILLLLSSASSVSILLLVGLPRYWLSVVPLLYLGLAYCLDSILKQFRLLRFEPLIVAASLLSFCSPNFIIPRPDFEVQALRHIAPLLRSHPVIGAWLASPYAVFAFRGDAKDVGVIEGIKAKDIVAGDFDVLMIDNAFRSTATWAEQRDFFEDLTHNPWKYDFKKITDVPTGRMDIYYRPRVPTP